MPSHTDLATPPAFIALDWGYTQAKAYLLAASGSVLDIRHAPVGVKYFSGLQVLEAIQTLCGDWLADYPEIPMIAAGLIGSHEGLREIAFAHTPADPMGLAAHIVRVDDLAGRPFAIIPGVCDSPLGYPPDLIQGMETKILGAMQTTACRDGVFVFPGTHSKWVKLKHGAIDTCRTYLTGELYEILCRKSILGQLSTPNPGDNTQGFAGGLKARREQNHQLAHLLFSVRSLGLLNQLAHADIPGYISGLLIGDEIADGLRWARTSHITLIGASALTPLYSHAFSTYACETQIMPDSLAANGMFHIAQGVLW